MVALNSRIHAISSFGVRLAPPASQPFRTPLALLLVAGIWLLLALLVTTLWDAWNRSETRILFEPRGKAHEPTPAYAPWSGAFVAYLVVLVLMWTLGALLLLRTPVTSGSLLLPPLMGLVAILTARQLRWTPRWQWVRSIVTRTGAGPLEDLKRRWEQLDRNYLERAAKRRSPWNTYLIGERQIRSSSTSDQAAGVATLRQAIQLGSADAAWLLGQYLEKEMPGVREADLDGAQEAYGAGMRLGDSRCAHWLGLLHEYRRNDLEAAKSAYRHSAFELDEPLSAHSLGLLLGREEGKQREAFKAFEKGVELRDPLSCLWLGDLRRRCAEDRGRRGDARSADVLLRAAAACYREAINLGESSAATALGELQLERGDPTGAQQAFREGTRLRSAASALALGRALMAEGRSVEAAEAFRRALELQHLRSRGSDDTTSTEPDEVAVEACWELGRLQEAQGRPSAAERLYRFAMLLVPAGVEQHPAAAAVALRLGRALMEGASPLDPLKDAETVLRRGFDLGSFECGLLLATHLAEGWRTEEALEIVQRIEAADRHETRLPLGRILERLRRMPEAVASYQRAAERSSEEAELALVRLLVLHRDLGLAKQVAEEQGWWESPHAALGLARLLVEGDAVESARQVLGRLVRGDDPQIYFEEGRVLEAAGDVGGATESYRSAMWRGSHVAARRLGRLLRQRGDADGARRAFSQARVLAAITADN